MARVPGRALTPLDHAVLRGWARGRPEVLVLGTVEFAEVVTDLVPTTTFMSVRPRELAEHLVRMPAGTLIVNAGSGRRASMNAILRRAPVPVTVLWYRYALRYRDHAIESKLIPSRLVNRWAVFEVPGPAAAEG